MEERYEFKYLDFTYQPLVNQIYSMLNEENKERFKDVYIKISERNKGLQVKPLYKFQHIGFIVRKSAYFITSIISFIGVYVGGAFIKACLTWFIHGIILRTLLFSFYKSILQISYTLFRGVINVIASVMSLDSSVGQTITENPWELPIEVWMPQLGYEIIGYVFLFLIIWVIVNFVTFYMRNRKNWNKDINHTFQYDLNRSLFMLQCDKDDTLEYIKRNFYKRYKRFIGSDFHTRKYITSYVNIIESRCLEMDSNIKLEEEVLKKQRFITVKEIVIHGIGWISYVLLSSWIIIGPMLVYSNVMYADNMETMMQGFGWWSRVSGFATSIADSLFSNITIYMNMFSWQKTWLGLWIVYIVILLIINFYKRVYRPSIRQHQRYYNFCNKKVLGIYNEKEKFTSVSIYHVWFWLFLLLFVPGIIIVSITL